DRIMPVLKTRIPAEKARWVPRSEVAREAKQTAADFLAQGRIELNLLDQRDLITSLVNAFMAENPSAETRPASSPSNDAMPAAAATNTPTTSAPLEAHGTAPALRDAYARNPSRVSVEQAKLKLQPLVLERIDTSAAAKMPREALARDLKGLVAELLTETKIQL